MSKTLEALMETTIELGVPLAIEEYIKNPALFDFDMQNNHKDAEYIAHYGDDIMYSRKNGAKNYQLLVKAIARLVIIAGEAGLTVFGNHYSYTNNKLEISKKDFQKSQLFC